MKSIASLLFVLCLATSARAEWTQIDLSSTSPAAASTTAVGVTVSTQIGMFATCSVVATVQGGTGGTLDIYVQTWFRTLAAPTGFWADVAHLTQLTAGNAQNTVAFTLTRFSPSAAAITTTLNVVSGTPLLPAGTVVPGLLGAQLRTVYKTGAGNTVGAAQQILATCSST